jgi:hypothetical protein
MSTSRAEPSNNPTEPIYFNIKRGIKADESAALKKMQ